MRIIPPRAAISFPHPAIVAGIATVSTGDTVPNAFSFTDQASVAQNTLIISNAITVSGINAPSPISISGSGSPAYDINGSGNFTSVPGFVNNGDTVRLRVTSGASAGNVISAIPNIGGVTDTWQVITAGSNSLRITWTNPTQNVDNTSLTDLTYMEVWGGTTNDPNAASLVATVEQSQSFYDLVSPGTGVKYYFLRAIDSDGTPSDFSDPIVRSF